MQFIKMRSAGVILGLAAIAGWALGALSAAAQVPDPPVRGVDAERIVPKTSPDADPDISIVRSTPAAPPRDAEQVLLVLREVIVDGEVTVFTTAQLQNFFADLIGRETSLAELFRRTQQVEDSYRKAGYVTSRVIVPAQRVEGGVFHVRVVEGFIDEVVISNPADDANLGPVAKAVQGYGARAKNQKPTRQDTLERALLLSNDLPGVTAQGVLRPAARPGATGGSDLHVLTTLDPWEAYIVVDNRGSEFTGPWAAFAGFALNSHTAFGERLEGVLYSTLDFEEQIVGQVTYSQNVFSNGLRAGVSVSNARTRPGEALDPLEFESDTRYGRAYLEYPFFRGVKFSMWGALTAEFTNSETTALGVLTADDNVRSIGIEVRGRLQDRFAGLTSFDVAVSSGVDAFGATEDTDPNKSRAEGTAQFTKVTGTIERSQAIPKTPLQVFARVGGQWASDPLLSVEEYSLGGARFGRGYEPSELTGDKALGASAELQVNLGPQVQKLPPFLRDVSAVQGYVFYDFGAVWDEDTGASDDARTLSSAGFGVRTRAFKKFGLDLELAKPLTRPTRAGGDKDWQPYIRVFATF